MKKVNWPNNIRVDGPDLRAVLDLVEAHFIAEAQTFLGDPTGVIHCGVVSNVGFGLLVDTGLPSPLENAIVSGGAFVDANRKFVESEGTTTLDISGVVGVVGATIWARAAAAQLEVDQEDRVLIAAGAETTTPSYTRLEDVLEWQATSGAAPAGSGWALVITINTWTTFMGWNIPNSYTRNLMWLNFGSLYQFAYQVREEIAEIKGVAASSWMSAPSRNMAQLHSDLTTATNRITNSNIPTTVMKAWGVITVNAGGSSLAFSGSKHSGIGTITYVSPAVYDVFMSPPLSATEAAQFAMCFPVGSTDVDKTFVPTYTLNGGGELTKVRVTAYESATGFILEADSFRIVVF